MTNKLPLALLFQLKKEARAAGDYIHIKDILKLLSPVFKINKK